MHPIAASSRPGAAMPLARRLMLPVSRETLPRVVRVQAPRDWLPVQVIGIDDWAWKRGQRYGRIVCGLERRRIVDLLPDREPVTIEGWLARSGSPRHFPRPRRRVRSGCDRSSTSSRAGHRSLAFDGGYEDDQQSGSQRNQPSGGESHRLS